MSEFDIIDQRNNLTGKSIEPVGSIEPDEKVIDNEKGISEENLEGLRAEFVSLGGLVTELPEVSSVRDWTMVGIHSKDVSGEDTVNLYLMMMGRWFNLNEYQEKSTGAHGGIDQFDTGTVVNFTGANTITEITEGWALSTQQHILYDGAGVFTTEKAGNYYVGWSLSFASSGNNKDYEMGVLKKSIGLQQGWAHRKIAASTDLGDMSALTVLELKKGDKISLGMLNEDDTTSAIIDHAGLLIFRIR